jgi:hypothetical protein
MIAAHSSRHQPAPRRTLLAKLLLTGIEWTDANQWAPALGITLTGLIFAYLKETFL